MLCGSAILAATASGLKVCLLSPPIFVVRGGKVDVGEEKGGCGNNEKRKKNVICMR